MFSPDVANATAEFARVLKPGGRVCSSVWVKPEGNPWTAIPAQAIATEAVRTWIPLENLGLSRRSPVGRLQLYRNALERLPVVSDDFSMTSQDLGKAGT